MSDPYSNPSSTYGSVPSEPVPGGPSYPPESATSPAPPSFPPNNAATSGSISSGSAAGDDTGGKVEEVKGKAGQVAGTAKDEAAGVAQDAKASASEVAGTAKEEAAKVASTAKDQASSLLSEATKNLRTQTTSGKEQAAVGLRGISGELSSLADGSQDQGPVADLARQASERLGGAAGWLEDRDLDGVLSDVQDFARRRPFAFIAIAVGAGVAVGRLTRALKDSPATSSSTSDQAGSATRGQVSGSESADASQFASPGRHSAVEADSAASFAPEITGTPEESSWGTPSGVVPEERR